MKIFKRTYLFLALSTLLAACSLDSSLADANEQQGLEDGPIQIHLRVSAADNAATTRAGSWQDNVNATDDEMMNVWTVVAVNTVDNKVAAIYACKPNGSPDQEVDDIATLPSAGTYRFYSFANMAPSVVKSLLGIADPLSPAPALTREGGNDPTGGDNGGEGGNGNEGGNGGDEDDATGEVAPNGGADNPTSAGDTFITDDNNYAANTNYPIPFADDETVAEAEANAVTVNVAGNNFDPTATNNYFGAKGIPMSNVQELTVTAGASITLVVVRMMAKIELQVYNDKGADVTLESFTLTDLTKNTNSNLKLLPTLTGHNSMEVVAHGDITPNLNGTPGTGKMTITKSLAISATTNSTTAGTPVKIPFYVNESVRPGNSFGHFFLKIKLEGETEERYVLIDDKGRTTADDNKWDYIARNDYRIIPVVLDDYKLDVIPYDFPPIGVYPCSVKEEDGLYTVNFHDYGHFHLLPKVTKISDSSVVQFTAAAPTGTYSSTSWGLIGDSFASSWGSWTDATKATAATDDGSFYRSGYTTNPAVDGDDVGGFPVWYPNTAGRPQWDPSASGNYQPFIFGYIADPATTLTSDRKVYHEFSIYLYKQGMSAPRQMTYRLYMTLDSDQMLYAPRHGASLRRRPHWQ